MFRKLQWRVSPKKRRRRKMANTKYVLGQITPGKLSTLLISKIRHRHVQNTSSVVEKIADSISHVVKILILKAKASLTVHSIKIFRIPR
jgi:hypothetical protein